MIRLILAVAALASLTACTTPEERAAALYSDFSSQCEQWLSNIDVELARTGQTGTPAQRAEAFQWCMQQMYAGYEMQETNRIASASALLGAGAAMTALGQPQSYQGSGAVTCSSTGIWTTCR